MAAWSINQVIAIICEPWCGQCLFTRLRVLTPVMGGYWYNNCQYSFFPEHGNWNSVWSYCAVLWGGHINFSNGYFICWSEYLFLLNVLPNALKSCWGELFWNHIDHRNAKTCSRAPRWCAFPGSFSWTTWSHTVDTLFFFLLHASPWYVLSQRFATFKHYTIWNGQKKI